jgi:hypothetical protein
MSRVSWQFYSKRRKSKIDVFLRSTNSIKAAIEKFVSLKIVPPMDLIHEHFRQLENSKLVTDQREKTTVENTVAQKRDEADEDITTHTPTSQYDDLIIIEHEAALDD